MDHMQDAELDHQSHELIDDSLLQPSGSGKRSTPYSRPPELRQYHKLAERKRRAALNELFDELRESLPTERSTAKSSKWDILTQAIQHIDALHRGQQAMEHELHELRNELAATRGTPVGVSGAPSAYSTPLDSYASGTVPVIHNRSSQHHARAGKSPQSPPHLEYPPGKESRSPSPNSPLPDLPPPPGRYSDYSLHSAPPVAPYLASHSSHARRTSSRSNGAL